MKIWAAVCVIVPILGSAKLQRDGVYASTTFAPSSLSRFSATGKSNNLDNESEKSEALRQRSTKKRELSTTLKTSWLHPLLVGSYSSRTYIDGARGVAIDTSKGHVYVTGASSDRRIGRRNRHQQRVRLRDGGLLG